MRSKDKKQFNWHIILVIILIISSALLYFGHYLIFHDKHHIFIYLLGDIAFVPIEVLLVTLIIHKLLSIREKRKLLEKLNMIIGAFFSEAGTWLLTYFSDYDPDIEDIRRKLIIETGWDRNKFKSSISSLNGYRFTVDQNKIDMEELKIFLKQKREFMLRLLENPNLLEHEKFTDLLWAVFHLTEELENRQNFKDLPQHDMEHLVLDIKRAYSLLIVQWFEYMNHLKESYPYLFSLALRTNPFDKNADPVIK